jgi:hypothetical protein
MRFTIRDVMWLTVVAAVALGWLNEQRKFAAHFERVASHTKLEPREGGVGHLHHAQRVAPPPPPSDNSN